MTAPTFEELQTAFQFRQRIEDALERRRIYRTRRLRDYERAKGVLMDMGIYPGCAEYDQALAVVRDWVGV